MNKKLFYGVIAILAVALLAGLYFFTQQKKSQTPSSQQTVKIGVVVPLTGNLAFVGEFMKNSLLLTKSDSVEFLFEDCMGNPKDAVNAAKKLITQNKVNCVVSGLSFISESVNPVCTNQNILHFILSFSPSMIDKQNVVRPFVSSTKEAEMIVSFIKENNYHKVAFLRHIEPDAEYAFKNTLQPLLKELNVEIVDIPFDNNNTKDFKNDLLKVKNSHADMLVIQSLAFNIPNIINTYKDYNLTIPILGDMNFLDIHDDATKEKVDGIPFIGLSYILTDEYKLYELNYKAAFKIEPFALGAFASDLSKVLNTVRSLDKKTYIDAVNDARIKGTIGAINYKPNGDQDIEYTFLKFSDKSITSYK
jgi:ABC-type branched-subunit amino acid transport system substrate-binding protein